MIANTRNATLTMVVHALNAYTTAFPDAPIAERSVSGRFAFSDGMTIRKGDGDQSHKRAPERPALLVWATPIPSRILRFTPIPMSRMKAGTTFRIDRR